MRVHVFAEDKPLPIAVEAMRRIYPQGVQGAIKEFLDKEGDLEVTTSTMASPSFGLGDEVLQSCDVLVYWSHKHWREIPDERVDAIQKAVLSGMGLIVLHSAHASKIFSRLLGTTTQCLRWRENDERQRVWNVCPSHPIAQGIGEWFDIPMDETYGEYFDIPQPDEQVFLTVSERGDVLRSGDCFHRGRGKIFYFSAGHETYPVYKQEEVQRIIINAVRWAKGSKDGDWPIWAREGNIPQQGKER